MLCKSGSRSLRSLRDASPPDEPAPSPLSSFVPDLAAHMSEIEHLGRAVFWRGEVGCAKVTINSGRKYLALAQRMYAMELGEVVVDRSHPSSRGRAASKGKGKEAADIVY